jgi:hypothetical protein
LSYAPSPSIYVVLPCSSVLWAYPCFFCRVTMCNLAAFTEPSPISLPRTLDIRISFVAYRCSPLWVLPVPLTSCRASVADGVERSTATSLLLPVICMPFIGTTHIFSPSLCNRVWMWVFMCRMAGSGMVCPAIFSRGMMGSNPSLLPDLGPHDFSPVLPQLGHGADEQEKPTELVLLQVTLQCAVALIMARSIHTY